jgi:SSS family solute:Na+ symporter
LFTKNVYEPLRPGRPEAHYVFVGRLCGVAVLVGAGLICTAFDSVLGMLKFLWEFNAIVAASFWAGLKWRRATRQGAWASMLVALVMFVILPLGLPVGFPGLRTLPSTLQQTHERTIQFEYEATARDVREREQQIARWSSPDSPPQSIAVGDKLRRSVVQPPRSIFWAQGIEAVDGRPAGSGMFNLEMWLLARVVPLSENPHALNETLRYLDKILLPFVVLIVVSLLTRPDDSAGIQRFFLRMRTPVRANRDEDVGAVEAAYAQPAATASTLLFPRSQFEFFKWTRRETTGFILAWIATLGVLGLLWAVLSIGS